MWKYNLLILQLIMHRFGDEKHLKMKLQAFQMPPFLFYGLKK
jgi:hypothetical protein